MAFLLCSGTNKRGNLCKQLACKNDFFCWHHKTIPAPIFIAIHILEELECPVCLEEYIPFAKALCGHHVCQQCRISMKKSGRSLCCPMCRDSRFKNIIDFWKIVSQIFLGQSPWTSWYQNQKLQMNTLQRMNALTPAQASILAKMVQNEPVSPKSLKILNAYFK